LVSLTSLPLQEEREIGRWNPKVASNQETAFHASKSTTPDGAGTQPKRDKGSQRRTNNLLGRFVRTSYFN
jgi:hypothetical protein